LKWELSRKVRRALSVLDAQALLDAIEYPAVITDTDGVGLLANSAAGDLLGEPLGKPPAEWKVTTEKEFHTLSGNHKSWSTPVTTSNGRYTLRTTPLTEKSDFHLCIFTPCGADEISSEREKRLLKTIDIRTRLLKVAEEKYRYLYEQASFGIVQLDPNGDWISANPTFLKMARISPEKMAEIRLEDLIGEGSEQFGEKFAAWLDKGDREPLKCRLIKEGDESPLYVSIWAQPIKNEERTVGLQLSIIDITEETRKLFEVQAENERVAESLENIVRSMLDALVVMAPDGRISKVNQATLDLLGYKENELIGKPVGTLFAGDPDQVAEHTRKFARLLKSPIAREVETSWRRADGSLVPISLNTSVMRDGRGKLAGIVGVARDQSENLLRIKLEETNRQLEKTLEDLKVLDAAKDDLVSMVGHELRGPLAGIRGYAEFLTEEEMQEKDRIPYAQKIVSEVDRLTRMVTEILDLAKMEAGKLRYYMEPSLIQNVVTDCVERARAAAKSKNITVNEKCEDCPKIVFDVDRIKQVMDNILSNAIKFSPEGGKIDVYASDHKHFVKVRVTDYGTGIPEKEKDAVFAKFEQTPDGRRAMVGTGLGMPIAKSIIEDGHRGRIWFESEGEGKGTSFFFTIPKFMKPSKDD